MLPCLCIGDLRNAFHGRRPGLNSRRAARRRLRFEPLEARSLLASVFGTALNDSIVLRPDPGDSSFTQALVNGVVQLDVPSASLTDVQILAGDGNDTITIGSGDLDLLKYAVSVDGQGGADRVIVNDQANVFGDTYTVNYASVDRYVFGGLTYTDIEALTLNAEAGNNTINVDYTDSGVPVTINAGAGNDAINVGGGNLDGLPAAVIVNGQAGTDTVSVNSQGEPFSDTFTVTSSSLTRPFFGGLTYGTIEGLTLNAESGDNTININSTAAGVPLTVNAGPGNDTINVGNGNLNSLKGAVTVNGQDGTDTVYVNDQANASGDTYTISYLSLARPFFGGLSYGFTNEGLVLNAESGNNTINIRSSHSDTPLTVNAGAGNDTINVGGGDLFPLAGAVRVNGQGGTDTVNVNDQLSFSSDTYTVTPNPASLRRAGIRRAHLHRDRGPDAQRRGGQQHDHPAEHHRGCPCPAVGQRRRRRRHRQRRLGVPQRVPLRPSPSTARPASTGSASTTRGSPSTTPTPSPPRR